MPAFILVFNVFFLAVSYTVILFFFAFGFPVPNAPALFTSQC